MAQFTLYRNKNPRSRAAAPFLLNVQSDLLEEMHSRVVIPLTKAAAQLPGDFRPLSRRGSAWLEKKEYQKAADDFSLALEIKPDPMDYVNRGRCYSALERVPEAIHDFDKAILDATAPVRGFLQRRGYHDFEHQGQADKVVRVDFSLTVGDNSGARSTDPSIRRCCSRSESRARTPCTCRRRRPPTRRGSRPP